MRVIKGMVLIDTRLPVPQSEAGYERRAPPRLRCRPLLHRIIGHHIIFYDSLFKRAGATSVVDSKHWIIRHPSRPLLPSGKTPSEATEVALRKKGLCYTQVVAIAVFGWPKSIS